MAGRVLALPNQTPKLIEQYGLTRAEVDQEVWVIDPDGHRWAGASAVNRVWRELGGVWRIAGRLYFFPPLQWVEDSVYRWVAEHRGLMAKVWSTTPECERSGVECE